MSAPPLASTVRGSKASLAQLPSVDRTLKLPGVPALIERHGRTFVTSEVRAMLHSWREATTSGRADAGTRRRRDCCTLCRANRLTPHVDGQTGLQSHRDGASYQPRAGTSGGRSDRSGSLGDARADQSRIRSRIRESVGTAMISSRHLLCELTGAEAATIVNNNAAAVLLTARGAGRQARGDRLARRAGRDRWRVPDARRDEERRRADGRGRHDQSQPRVRLCRRDQRARRR